MRNVVRPLLLATIFCASCPGAAVLHAAESNQMTAYQQINLTSNIPGLAAHTDPNLQNPWGMAWSPGNSNWVADNNNGLSTLYSGAGANFPLREVFVPPAAGQTTANPSGIIWNPNSNREFIIPGSKVPAIFIMDGEDGTITAWALALDPEVNGQSTANMVIDNSAKGAVYKGLAYGSNIHGNFIFATNFNAGTIEAYDVNFHLTQLDGSFTDPDIPEGFAPFGIANIDGDLFVTYALQDAAKHDSVAGAGLGFVDVFSTDGVFIRRFASRGVLNAPWGVARATQGFGVAADRILIGNFGSKGAFAGWINSFDGQGKFLGELRSPQGAPISIDGLWALAFGNFAEADGDTLYFTAGPNDETNGLFGAIKAVKPDSNAGDSDQTMAE